MKKPTRQLFITILKTLGEQGFIDFEPTEGEYDCTKIYDFLVASGIAIRTGGKKYWLKLVNNNACLMLEDILKEGDE